MNFELTDLLIDDIISAMENQDVEYAVDAQVWMDMETNLFYTQIIHKDCDFTFQLVRKQHAGLDNTRAKT